MTGGASCRSLYWRSTDGLMLHAAVYEARSTEAPTVLCLPGLTRNSRDFESLAPHLAPRCRVVCADLRGRGRSARDPRWQNYHAVTYLADLMVLIDTLQISALAIVGTSLGGLLGILLGAARPDLLRGIVLNDIGPEADPAGLERIRCYVGRLAPVRDWTEAIIQHQSVFGRAWPGLSASEWALVTRRAYHEDERGIPVLDVDPGVGWAFREAAMPSLDLWSAYASLGETPTLGIRGALSDILSVETFARMKRAKPDLVQITVPNRGHPPLLNEPACIAAINSWLDRVLDCVRLR